MVHIEFGSLNVKQIANTSGIFTGDNIQINFNSSRKINEGLGSTSGDRTIVIDGRHVVLDNDIFDFSTSESGDE
ncbi:hypothetical protein [Alteribacter natronophilus]|uniref:hypothetical protein n=1 Tax=Alteribacter natronophilus TaxID=2583810 RepID=UPI00110EB016|nr:hypothetical protein [Alteribacter natronophilus]TMW70706.1 hypothetical protein FGB90_16115 [Alteribacter natronophilus]